MKKTAGIIGAVLALAVSLAGCQSQDKTADTDTIKVMASFYTMGDLAQKAGGEKVQVTTMVPAGTEPHDWEPSAQDIAMLEEADIFIYNGAGMEHWAEDVLGTLENKDLIVVEAAEDIELLGSHGHQGEAEAYDPHVWLDPQNGKKQMQRIEQALEKAAPEEKEYFQENSEKYEEEFDELDKEYREQLEPLPNKNIIVAHEAFGYLCQAYGLNQIGIEGLSPDSEPDPKKMEEIIEFARENQVKTIFFEELTSPKVAETIAKETGAETAVLNPLEGLKEEEIEEGKDYFSVMRENLQALVKALQ